MQRLRCRSALAYLCAILFIARAFPAPADAIVNDVSQLNPIHVREILVPTSVAQVIAAVRSHDGPISIGGGRFSMGGQTATDGALQLDMRHLDRIVRLSKETKEITVQAGITWRKVQEYIDPYDLSVLVMQSYDNFTVGGSLSVNVHGRYIGQGPIVTSVKSIRIVLADGNAVDASPTENSDLFYGAIGGYGSLGVIVEATLRLTDNIRVERQSIVMPLANYRAYFLKNVRNNRDIVFHNADLYPNAFDTVRATSYVRTDKPVTVTDRLFPASDSYKLDRVVFRSSPNGRRASGSASTLLTPGNIGASALSGETTRRATMPGSWNRHRAKSPPMCYRNTSCPPIGLKSSPPRWARSSSGTT